MNRITLALGVALVALVVAAPVAAHSSAAAATTDTVTMFTLSKAKVPHGKVTFKLTNKGKIPHDFSIAGKKSKSIPAGKTGTLIVTLKKGKLPYKCTLDSHAKLGMKGTLTVT